MTNEIKKNKPTSNHKMYILLMIARLQTHYLFFFDGDYYEANWNEMHLFCQYLVKHENR